MTISWIECPTCCGQGELSTGAVDPECGPIYQLCGDCLGEGQIPDRWECIDGCGREVDLQGEVCESCWALRCQWADGDFRLREKLGD